MNQLLVTQHEPVASDQRFLIYEDGRSLIGATRGEIDYKSYKRTPKWELASDPNLANS